MVVINGEHQANVFQQKHKQKNKGGQSWQAVEKRRRKKADLEANNWNEYFYSIRKVCPWSYSAWKSNKIDIVRWTGVVYDLGELEARCYVLDRKPRLLKKIEKRLNEQRSHEEWLHSHPSFGPNATPQPVLIQQDYAKLAQARKKYYGNVL